MGETNTTTAPIFWVASQAMTSWGVLLRYKSTRSPRPMPRWARPVAKRSTMSASLR